MNYEGLPEGLREGARLWIEHGIEPGSFLTAVIRNDLKEACAMADDENRFRLFQIVSWWYNKAPELCWGSPNRFESWGKMHEECRAESERRSSEGKAP